MFGHWLLAHLRDIVQVGLFLWWLHWTETPKRRCKCGKVREWYFHSVHRKVGWMIAFGVVQTLASIGVALNVHGLRSWPGAIVTILVGVWVWRWVYFHEKDRLRRAARALGRVFVNEHGRLAVSTER
jgi:hypothetical protein